MLGPEADDHDAPLPEGGEGVVIAAPAVKRSAGRNLPAAIAVGVVLSAIIVASLLWWNWGFVILWGLAIALGSREVLNALSLIGMHGERWPIIIGGALTFAATYATANVTSHAHGIAILVGGLVLITLACLALRLRGPVADFVKDASASLFTLTYVVLLGSTLALVLAKPDGGLNVLMLFVCVPLNDTGAYAFGSFFGRHKMAPKISPGKTWEGFVGGVLCAGLSGAGYAVWFLHEQWWIGALIGVCLGLAATVGDLVESMIKRNAGLKDMSKLLPGHGGAMDRMDSLLAAAPLLWLLMYAFGV